MRRQIQEIRELFIQARRNLPPPVIPAGPAVLPGPIRLPVALARQEVVYRPIGRRLGFDNEPNEEFNNAIRAQQPIQLQQPPMPGQIQPWLPQPPQGVAFAIHNSFNRINKPEFFAFIERQIPGISAGPLQIAINYTNAQFGEHILRSMDELKAGLPEANRITVTQQINQFADRLPLDVYGNQEKK